MRDNVLALLSSVIVPIVVALISSGTLANLISKKLGVGDLSKKVDDLKYEISEFKADTYRNRVLRFNDDLLSGKNRTKEAFDDCLNDIDQYERFCNLHPDYPNNKCVLAIENIKREYREKSENNSF